MLHTAAGASSQLGTAHRIRLSGTGRAALFDPVQNELDATVHILSNTGNGGCVKCANTYSVEAGDNHILRHTDACLLQYGAGCDSHRIIRADDGFRQWRIGQKMFHGIPCRSVPEVSVTDHTAVEGNPILLQYRAKSINPLIREGIALDTGDHMHISAAMIHQHMPDHIHKTVPEIIIQVDTARMRQFISKNRDALSFSYLTDPVT